MGRRKTPTPILKLRGSKHLRYERDATLEVPCEVPPPPHELSPAAAEVWATLTESLRRIGVVAVTDAQMLARYCELEAEWWSIPICEETTGRRLNINAALVKIENLFGMSPVSRADLSPNATTKDRAIDFLDDTNKAAAG